MDELNFRRLAERDVRQRGRAHHLDLRAEGRTRRRRARVADGLRAQQPAARRLPYHGHRIFLIVDGLENGKPGSVRHERRPSSSLLHLASSA